MASVTRFCISLLVALSLSAAACTPSPTTPSNLAPFSLTDLREGTGDIVVLGDTVSVRYVGWLYDASAPDNKGPQFEASADGSVLTFTLGFGSVIAGWDEGVPGMRVGGLRRLVIPPSLAYGDRRRGSIPPNATLVFEIELVRIEE